VTGRLFAEAANRVVITAILVILHCRSASSIPASSEVGIWPAEHLVPHSAFIARPDPDA
jgi:hypothetical protein